MQRFGKVLFHAGRKALALGLTMGLGGWTLPAKPADDQSTQTVKNLNAALNGERNAAARYAAFAEKADQEGYGAVASLFRAAAAAEDVHGNNHQEAIQRLGGSLDIKTETPPVVQSTAENLQTAISGESHE
jgi:rubrerythrin